MMPLHISQSAELFSFPRVCVCTIITLSGNTYRMRVRACAYAIPYTCVCVLEINLGIVTLYVCVVNAFPGIHNKTEIGDRRNRKWNWFREYRKIYILR